jgi:hypothetical protein
MKELEKKEFKKFGILALVISLVVVGGGIAAYHYSQREPDDKKEIGSEKEES